MDTKPIGNRSLPLALLGLIVLLGISGWVFLGREPIQPGMTFEEVKGRLGEPTGRMTAVGTKAMEEVVLVWKDQSLVIEFDENDLVRSVKRAPSLMDRLRGLFGI